ncbi:MAG: ureD urease accessory family protein, partial [Massilia sp.]|nr:ureD urease accessory family protein [Massilia sp.]
MNLHEAADLAHPDLLRTPDWQARLGLGFSDDAGATRLTERSHFGPLRVQKPLYPEGPQVCHAIVVHPPGGVVGGDELAVTATVGAAAHAFITTPGAAKWYKANGRISRQDITLDIAAGARLEWLPQETIFFDAAQVQLTQSVSLAKDAGYI